MFSQNKTNNLKGFHVFNESGVYLGKVVRVFIDIKNQDLKNITVRKVFIVPFGQKLIIDRSQILNVEDKKVIVSDASSKIAQGVAV